MLRPFFCNAANLNPMPFPLRLNGKKERQVLTREPAPPEDSSPQAMRNSWMWKLPDL